MIQKLLGRAIPVILAGSIIVGLTGCVFSLGGSKEVTSTRTTRGQELIDLKRARDQGAITPEEYEAKRRQILDR
jgi:Short C-terminal domain